MFTQFDRIKLQNLQKTYGDEFTSETALKESLRNEEVMKNLGPFDPAFVRFASEQRAYENMAELLEKKELHEASLRK